MKRSSIALSLCCALAAGLLAAVGREPARTSARADDAGRDLAKQVTIRRDAYGVPHILADTEAAAAFGHGYASAEDHVLTMARLFLQARGEEAAHFGERFAEADFLVKHLKIHEVAEAGYARMPPWLRWLLDAYAAGYNHYLAKHKGTLPDWVRPVSAVDVIAHVRRVVIVRFAMDLRPLDRIGRKAALPPEKVSGPFSAAEKGPDTFSGSNMWAVGKGRSASGKGLLLGNPHLIWAGSDLFYEVHLTVPGKLNVSGAGLIGQPGVGLGFNEHLGWSHTVNPHDSTDVYELTPDPQDKHRYLYDGRSLPLRKEELAVQVKTDKGPVTHKKEVFWSHHGPVLKWHDGKAYAVKSSNLDEYRFIEQWNRMSKAKSLDEFRKVLDMQALPMFNLCYADKAGNVFYLFNGRFPDRPPGYDWNGVVPGNTSATEWSWVLPQGRLPSLVNPPGGYVQNCNSAPWYTNLRQVLDRTKYPPELCPNVNDLRQQLSLEMIEAEEKWTLDKVMKAKYSTRLLLADRVKGDLLKLARGQTVDGVGLDEAADVLQDWDNTVSRESKGALLFVTFWRTYRDKAKAPFAVPWDEKKPAATPSGLGDPETARAVLAATVKDVKKRFGQLTVPWGDVFRLRRGDLDVPVGGLTGDFGAFRIIGYEPDKDGKFVARGGDSYVMAVEFTSPPTAYSIVAYSQSGDPKSPHYNDQSKLFAEEKWKRAWFSEEDVAKNAKRSYQP